MRPHTSSVIGTMGDNVSELTRAYWNEIGIRTNYKQLSEELWDLQAELLSTIGTVAKTVRPMIINNRIRNVPEVLPFSFASFLWVQAVPAQWHIEE